MEYWTEKDDRRVKIAAISIFSFLMLVVLLGSLFYEEPACREVHLFDAVECDTTGDGNPDTVMPLFEEGS